MIERSEQISLGYFFFFYDPNLRVVNRSWKFTKFFIDIIRVFLRNSRKSNLFEKSSELFARFMNKDNPDLESQ